MRIIGGTHRGKSIFPPSGFSARPTTDFAKEGLFNILSNEFDLGQCRVLDLFSGTGGISYEFASRGCTSILAVEMNPLHYRFIKKNAELFQFDSIRVVRHNVFDFIEICKVDFDIIFADPPYSIEGLDTIPEKIFGRVISPEGTGMLREGGQLILEHPDNYSFISHRRFLKEKKYGNVCFSFFE